jgi:catechol 2,3-dioxygenase-like lactoylglutathione lyase family enzyme
MAIQGVFYVRISVADVARSRAFYSEQLGWKVQTDQPEVVGLWFGAGYLVAAADEAGPKSGGMRVAVKVDDLDAQHQSLKQKGVAVSQIEKQPWGERNFSFTDPDGYSWIYSQA